MKYNIWNEMSGQSRVEPVHELGRVVQQFVSWVDRNYMMMKPPTNGPIQPI